VSLGGTVLPGKDLDRVASLPTREQALAQLLGVLKAPIASSCARWPSLTRSSSARSPRSRTRSRPLRRRPVVSTEYHSVSKTFSGAMTMAATKEDILNAISNMTVMEIVDLVKMMEDKFGVTAAAPVAVAAAGGGAAAAAAPAPKSRRSSPSP
jgi:hypothetical protein